METRLQEPGQTYLALPDRPTIADLSYFPFAMPWMFGFLGENVENWPKIKGWGEKMLKRQAVHDVVRKGPMYGH